MRKRLHHPIIAYKVAFHLMFRGSVNAVATEFFQVAFNYELELQHLQEDLESLKKANTWAMACSEFHALTATADILRRVYVMQKERYDGILQVRDAAVYIFDEKIREFCE